MTSDHTPTQEETGTADRVVSVFGVEIVLEEDFVTFPWRAGLRRGPIAFALVYVVVLVLASIGGLGRGPLVGQLSVLGLVVYNAHYVQATLGGVPNVLSPVADTLAGLPVVGRLLRGLLTTGFQHESPLVHLPDILAGNVGTIGHVNFIEQQQAPIVPPVVYYAVPVVVLVAVGWWYARTYWERAATDSPIEVTRFGLALGVGYLLTLLVGTIVISVEMASPLAPDQTFIVIPDRYLTILLGFVYPAVFGSVGAGLVYLQREVFDAPADGSESDARPDEG